MKKKIVAGWLLFLIWMIGTLPVYAFTTQSELETNSVSTAAFSNLSASIDSISKQVTIQGNIDTGANQQVTVKVTDPDGIIDYINQISSGANGAFSFTYTTACTVGGTFAVQLNGTGIVTPGNLSFDYNPSSPQDGFSNVSISTKQSTREITITGNISSGPDKQVTIRVEDPNGNPDYINQKTSQANGVFSFTYTTTSTASGTFTVQLSGAGIAGMYKASFIIAETVIVSPTSSEVIVDNTPLEIIIPADVNNTVLNTHSDNGKSTLPQVNVQSQTSLGKVEVSIPDGTQVTGPSDWDGTITLPQVRENSSVNVTPSEGNTATVSAVIEIGLADKTLTFNKPVRILLAGQGGKKAGWIQNGIFTPITYQMASDSADALGSNNDGYLTVGNDLVIWTRHFTTFVAYSEAATDECFIATAAFGSKFTWPVALLRHFRDQYLLTNSIGKAFVDVYYQNSPPIAAFIATSEPLKMLVRVLLAPIIAIVYLIYHPILMGIILLLLILFSAYHNRTKIIQTSVF